MPTLYRYKLFISHAWHRSEAYESIIAFLDGAPHFVYSNYSVPEDRAFDRMSRAELQEQIREQIRPVDMVIILAGLYVAHSDWIQFEINYAKAIGKPIIGIQPWGSTNTPKAVSDAANEIVGWNTASIISAIRRNS